jgi:integrase
VESIRNYLSGVKLLHLFTGHSYPDFGAFELTLALRGLRRLLSHTPKQALPMTPDILLKIHQNLDLAKPVHSTYWCAFLFAFYLMLRKSNLVPVSSSAFDSTKQLTRGDVLVSSSALLVVIRWSKTVQFSQRVIKLPLTAIPSSPLCPVTAYTRMITLCPAKCSDPAFSRIKKGKAIAISYTELQSFLRHSLQQVGFNPSLYSSHSFRRGGATWAFRAGVPSDLIQLQGDWASDAYKRYLQYPLESKLMVFHKMRDLICSF